MERTWWHMYLRRSVSCDAFVCPAVLQVCTVQWYNNVIVISRIAVDTAVHFSHCHLHNGQRPKFAAGGCKLERAGAVFILKQKTS